MSDEGVDKIVSYIQAEAEEEISQILGEAQTEADKIKKAAENKAGHEADKILSDGKRAASLEEQRMLAEKRIQVRRKRMDAQEEAIDSSFAEARKVLEELTEKGKRDGVAYKDILFNLIVSASEVVAGKRLELVLNQRDRKSFKKEMLEEITALVNERTGRNMSLDLVDEPMQFLGGVVVRDVENSVEVDHTLETRLSRLRESIRVDVAKILFGNRL
jgi:V/A-type H+-transporting ATPase subunit E